MKKIGIIVVVLLLLLGAVAFFLLKNKALRIEMTAQDIEKKLSEKFPTSKDILEGLLKLDLEQPKALFKPGQDRLHFVITAHLTLKKQKESSEEPPKRGPFGGEGPFKKEPPLKKLDGNLTGVIRFSTQLYYHPTDFQFKLKDPTVDGIEIENIPVKQIEQVSTAINKILLEKISENAVGDIREDIKKSEMARLLLKEMKIEEGKVVLLLGL
jgi:hypothetical protein